MSNAEHTRSLASSVPTPGHPGQGVGLASDMTETGTTAPSIRGGHIGLIVVGSLATGLAALQVMTLTTPRMPSEANATSVDSTAPLVPTPIASPTPARARASSTLSPAYCSHEKDQHGWQHKARDHARTLGSN